MTPRSPRESRISDWIGFTLFLSFAILALRQAAATTILLLPTVVYDLFVAVSFLIREPIRAAVPSVGARLAAHGGTFFMLVCVPLAGRINPDWVAMNQEGPLVAAGWAIWLAGSLFVAYSIWSLRRSFSIEPQARRLVTSGPYAFARHPVYAGYMMQYAGMLMIVRTVPFAALVYAWLLLVRQRIRYEEAVLASAFPEYTEYRLRVGALCPLLFRRSPGRTLPSTTA
jgi:protein-S-isoprenylcysteine O-methyltransferase Ste14